MRKNKMIIISIDWAIRKPLFYYNGIVVKETYNPSDIKADIILIETGAPYSLISHLAQTKSKILVVKGEDTNKFRNGIKESDSDDAIAIFELYKVNPELFSEIDQRNIVENRLRYHIKMRQSLLKSITKMSNESESLKKEYIVSDIHHEIIETLERRMKLHEEEILRWSNYLYSLQIMVVTSTKLMAELNASIFVSLVNVSKFSSYSKFKKFCGFAPKNITQYNRDIKTVVWTSCDSTIIKHRLEPYRTKYDKYKEKKFNELKIKNPNTKGIKGHAHALAMRKVCQLMLKQIWKKLRNVVDDTTPLDDSFKINIPKQSIEGIDYKDNKIIINLKRNKHQPTLADY